MGLYTIIVAVRSCMTTGRDTIPGFEFLMVKNRRRGGWELPGGRAELGEDAVTCAEREFVEETGLEARDLRLIHRRTGPLGDGHVFLAQVGGTRGVPIELEIEAVEWFRALPPLEGLSFPNDPYVETFAAARRAIEAGYATRRAGP